MRIAVVATGTRIEPALAQQVLDVVALAEGADAPEVTFHPQCFEQSGHFAGDDDARARAFLETANDPRFDAVWFARGGYGACRLAELILPRLNDAARAKRYLGYSDAGFLLAGLYKAGCAHVAHGPMPVDIIRDGGDVALLRGLAFLRGDLGGIEPHVTPGGKTAAFNMTVLSHLLGTDLEPDLAGHVLMLEDVNEYMYRLDRALFHITSQPTIRRVAGIMLGRCDPIPPNEPDFQLSDEDVTRYWCAKSGIAYLGRADIGHDIANKVVPFGGLPAADRR